MKIRIILILVTVLLYASKISAQITIESVYRPYTYEEYLAPLLRLEQAYNETMNAIDALTEYIMDILNHCMRIGCKVISIKDNYELGDDIQSKVLAFAFGLSAEIERNLISQRTKEALIRKKEEGVTLGRPKGRKSSVVKLSGKRQQILDYLAQGKSKTWISRKYKVHRNTLAAFLASDRE